MSAPVTANELYFYDGHLKRFIVKRSAVLYDMVGLQFPAELAQERSIRIADMDSPVSEIVEIPRLNVADKVSVQLLFLSKFQGIVHEEASTLAAEQQADVPGFVLDDLEGMNKVLSTLTPYWEDFKIKTIQYYLEQFTGITGITLKMF